MVDEDSVSEKGWSWSNFSQSPSHADVWVFRPFRMKVGRGPVEVGTVLGMAEKNMVLGMGRFVAPSVEALGDVVTTRRWEETFVDAGRCDDVMM